MADTKKRFFYGWVVAGVLFLIALLPMTFMNTFFSYYQVPVSEAFGISYAEFNVANTVSSFGGMLFSLVLASKVTKGNIRVWMLGGAAIAAVAYFSMGFATAMWQIDVLIFIALFCVSAITYVPINYLISQWFIDKKGIVTSVIFAGTGLGGVLFSNMEASLIENQGWQNGFRVTGAIILVTGIIVFLFVRKTPAEMGLSPYTSKTTAAKAESQGAASAPVTGLTKAEALKTVSFYFYAVALLFIGMVSAGIITQLPAYLTDNNVGYAMVMAVVSAAMILGKLVLGVVIDKAGIIKGIMVGCACGLIGLIVLMLVPGIGSLPAYVAAVLIPIGMSTSSVIPPLITSTLFGYKDFGGIYGLGNMLFFAGCMVGPLVSSGICTVLGSYAVAWIVFCVIFALITVFSVLAAKNKASEA